MLSMPSLAAWVLVAGMQLIAITQAQLSNITTPLLNLTTIAAINQSAVLQCWQLTNPFTTTSQPGVSGALNLPLGNIANMSYTIVPSRFDGGVHRAPAAQYVVFLSGLAHITLPNVTTTSTTEAWVQGGKYGTILAIDTANVSQYGHITRYPGDADTVLLQIPIAGELPDHKILYSGPCRWEEMTGL